MLVGAKRAKVIRELDAGRPFRIAEVEAYTDIYPPIGADKRRALKHRLLEAFGSIIPQSANVQQNLHELMAGQMGLGPITDIIAYTLPFEPKDKLALLAEADVDARALQLVKLLQSGCVQLHSVSVQEHALDENQSTDDRFPPPFSLN